MIVKQILTNIKNTIAISIKILIIKMQIYIKWLTVLNSQNCEMTNKEFVRIS